MKLILISMVFAATILSNCQSEVQSSDITKIEFGTSFGMCAGNCTQILTVTPGSIEKEIIPRNTEGVDLESICSEFGDFTNLFQKVDLDRFMELSEVIGCPDCADGGSEWVEITTEKGAKKVTYEYGNEPKEVKTFIIDLRELYDSLGECE